MSFSKYRSIYIDLLPIFVPSTTLLGVMTGLSSLGQHKSSLDVFTSTIGFTSIGIITGITFPISYPLLGVYVIFKNINKPE